MEEFVRPSQAPPPSAGYRTPPVGAVNEGEPTTTFGAAPNGQSDLGPFARTDEPEDYGWWPRLRMLLTGAQEVASAWKNVSGSVTLDPNACSVWRLRCQSAALSITFAALETPAWIDQLLIWAGVKRIATVEIIIAWQVAASGSSRTLTLSDVMFEDGEAPDWTPTVGTDIFHVQVTSDGDKYGFVLGLDMAAP